MANDNIITHFTAADIEKYHRGQLSAKQMHDLEKAALDDPFLADALNGYSVAGVNVAVDMAELKNRMAEKMEGAKVIPLQTAPRNSYRSLRAAVMILFIAGAGLLVYKFGFNTKKDLAQNTPVKKEVAKIDSVTLPTDIKGTVSAPATGIKDSKQVPVKNDLVGANSELDQETIPSKRTEDNGAGVKQVPGSNITSGDIVITKTETKPVTSAPVRAGYETDKTLNKPVPAEKKEIAREDKYNDKAKAGIDEGAVVKDRLEQQQNNRNIAAGRKADNNVYNYGALSNTSTFRGRVTDADNNGVPFANVTNVQDNNAGTYTDARGYFNLTYPDSVLTVQVRSIGFESNNVQLRNAVPTNQVVMQDDRKSLNEVVLSNQKSNATTRSRDTNMKIEEPEPVDGWVYYDAYLANNLEVPEDLKNKPSSTGEVQVSFEVDKNGEPTAFKIEKSLCTKCDKEAIRLIKEGPKWKRNANKKGRTTVTITF